MQGYASILKTGPQRTPLGKAYKVVTLMTIIVRDWAENWGDTRDPDVLNENTPKIRNAP